MKIAHAGFSKALKSPDNRTAVRLALDEYDAERVNEMNDETRESMEIDLFLEGVLSWEETRFVSSGLRSLEKAQSHHDFEYRNNHDGSVHRYIDAEDADLDESSWYDALSDDFHNRFRTHDDEISAQF
jgi:hypothetical protein